MMRRDSIRVSEKHGVNPSLDTCIYCGESKGIILFGKLAGDREAPRNVVTNYDPCDKCKENMDLGITFIEVSDDRTPTGRYWVVKENVVENTLTPDVLKGVLEHRKCFIPKEVSANLFGAE